MFPSLPKTTALEPPMKTLTSTTPYKRFHLAHETCSLTAHWLTALEHVCWTSKDLKHPGQFWSFQENKMLSFESQQNKTSVQLVWADKEDVVIICQAQAVVMFCYYLDFGFLWGAIFNSKAIKTKKQTAQNSEASFRKVTIRIQLWKIIKQL